MFAHSLKQELEHRGISRRDFLGFCASMAAVLGLAGYASSCDCAAVESEQKPILVWLEFQDCAGNTRIFSACHPSDGRRSHPGYDFAQLSRNFDGRSR